MSQSGQEPNSEVTKFAAALNDWATQGPDREQKQLLLRWLLTRCESHSFKGWPDGKPQESREPDRRVIIRRLCMDQIDIVKAVERALADYHSDLSTSGWVRGGPIWLRSYGDVWLRSYGS
jgi:hypothetical protein